MIPGAQDGKGLRARLASPGARADGRRRRIFLLLGLAAALLSAGCGKSPLKARYCAERDLWRAVKLERQWNLQPERETEGLARVQEAYKRILDKYPVSSASGDSAASLALLRLRGSVTSSLARVYLRGGSTNQAVQALWDARTESRKDLATSVQIYGELATLLARVQNVDSLSLILREMTEELPAVTPEGEPVALVLESPIRLADLLIRTQESDGAAEALDQASSFYEKIARENAGTPAEVAALVQQANVRMRQGRAADAAEMLRHIRSLPQAGPYEAGILYSLGTVQEHGLNDPLGAVATYRELIRLHPDDPSAAQAMLREAIAFTTADMPDSSLAVFSRTEERYGEDQAVAAQARFLSAKELMKINQGAEAVRRLRSLTADFPRTALGLQAPMEIAEYYGRIGNTTAEQATLREAAAEYERVVQDLSGTRSQQMLILTALDRLASVRVRLQDWDAAVDALSRRADNYPADPGSPLALLQAAAIREVKMGDPKGSIALLQRMAERYPKHPLVPKVREKITQLESGS